MLRIFERLQQDLESTRYVTSVPPMLISGMFFDGRSLMFFNALIQVLACVADIICIARITLEMVNNALLGLLSFGLMLDPSFQLVYMGWISFPILRLNSPSYLRTEFADLWSLNDNIILTGALLSSHVCLDLTSPETFAVTKSLIAYCKSGTG